MFTRTTRRSAPVERPFLQPLTRRSGSAAVIVNQCTGEPLATSVEAAFDSTSRKRGLLGRVALERRHAVVIAPTNAIHTWFMRFAIDVVFAAKDGTVVGLRRALRPWRIAIAPRAFCAIELAAGTIDRHSIAVGDRLIVTGADA
jgi:uncharacterized membrane protein (UPF0127 family)